MAHSKTEITIVTNERDPGLAKVLATALENTYGTIAKGEAAKLSVALDNAERGGPVQEQQAKAAEPELTPAQLAAREIGKSMKGTVQGADHASPSRVAHVAEVKSPDPDAKGIV